MTAFTPGLHVHTAWRSDVLAQGLAEVLVEPLADPFAREVVSVPTPGVERWLAQSLSTQLGTSDFHDGVSAGIEFPTLGRMIRETVAVSTGVDPDADPWQPQRLVWHVLATMDAVRGEPWFSVVAEHLYRQDDRPGRRFRTGQRLAHLFASYAEQRPELLVDWSKHNDDVPEDLRWQPALWRAVQSRIGDDPAARLPRAVERLRQTPDISTLPPRISIFGPTRLSATQIAILSALAEHREVHLWLQQSSPVSAPPTAIDTTGVRQPAMHDSSAHPLTARLGRDSAELTQVLGGMAIASWRQHDAPVGGGSLLRAVQADVVAARQPRHDHVLDPDDRSVQFHGCHGPERQVEVLREVVLGLLADDPSLEPRDIVVMCPDIESYAPHISALFDGSTHDDSHPHHPAHRIPVRLADRSLRQINPVLAVLDLLFGLVHHRARASDLLALCAAPPVARRFSFSDEDLDVIANLVDRAEVRWGIDQADLQQHGMSDFTANTWLAGLDRLLVGVALPATQSLRGITPVDVTSSSQVDLIGRLAELITRLRRISVDFATAKSVQAWVTSMRRALELVAEVGPNDDWQIHHAYATLADLTDTAAEQAPELQSADVAELLANVFRGRPSRASFRTGALTVCTLAPMRSVPHRVVILLGLDDGNFPRRARAVGDDLLARTPQIGERDQAAEDRQLLLDAVLSATDTLVVIYTGRDPHSNRAVPMCIPVTDLHETFTRTVATTSSTAWEHLHHQHPLQPFSPRNFVAAHPRSFDTGALAGARALVRPREPAPTLVDVRTPLPPVPVDTVELTDLISMFSNPLQHFLKARGLSVYDNEVDPYAEEITSDLNSLDTWALNQRILNSLLRGLPRDDIERLEAKSGKLPPYELGRQAVQRALNEMAELVQTARGIGTVHGMPHAMQVEVANVLVTGAVPVTDHQHLVVSQSKRRPKDHIMLWLNHLALCATDASRPWESVLIAHQGSYQHRIIRYPTVPTAQAREFLADLIPIYQLGLQRALPLPARLAMDWQSWKSSRPFDPSQPWKFSEPIWKRHFTGPQDIFGGTQPENSEFASLSARVWAPLLAHEERR